MATEEIFDKPSLVKVEISNRSLVQDLIEDKSQIIVEIVGRSLVK